MISGAIMCYDEEKNIKRAIDSILHLVDELVILDGGSHDKTQQIIESYNDPKIKIFIHPTKGPRIDTWSRQNITEEDKKNFNEPYRRNQLLSLCSGEWILLIDADEVLDPILTKERVKELTELGESCRGIVFKWFHFFGDDKHIRIDGGFHPTANSKPTLFKKHGAYYENKPLDSMIMYEKMPMIQKCVPVNLKLLHYHYMEFPSKIGEIIEYEEEDW